MVPELLLLASMSATNHPRITMPLSPTEAILASCDHEEAGDIDGAIRVLQAANAAAETTPTTSTYPEY
jgi:hypothetical protein